VFARAQRVSGLRELVTAMWLPLRHCLERRRDAYVELTAGAKPRTRAAAGIWSTNRAIRDAERALMLQAEVSDKPMATDQ
jgi:hypothetical protein